MSREVFYMNMRQSNKRVGHVCIVPISESDGVYAVGWSKCSKGDKFNASEGCRISLKRANKVVDSVRTMSGLKSMKSSLENFHTITNTHTIPYILCDNIDYYISNYKHRMGIKRDCIFLIYSTRYESKKVMEFVYLTM